MQTEIKTKACGKCVYWKSMDSNSGECRRHAPQMIAFEVDDVVKFESRFPMTAAEDWCGDFEKAE